MWYSPGAFSHLLPGLLLLGGVRFDMLSQRAGIGVAFLAALNLTRVWFLKHTGSSNSVSGPPPPLDISVFWIWNVDSPCRHVCAGAWHGRWSCWRLSDSQGADTCTVSLLCGFVSGFWGSLGGRTPSDSLQTNIKKWRRRETSLEMFKSNRFFLYRIDTWPDQHYLHMLQPGGVSIFLFKSINCLLAEFITHYPQLWQWGEGIFLSITV